MTGNRHQPMDYPQLLDHLSIGVAVLDAHLTVLFWNRWLEEHSLLRREEMIGRPIHELFRPHIRKEFINKAREVVTSRAPAFFTHKAHQHMFPFLTVRSYLDNELMRMEQTVILSPLQDEEGVVRHIAVSVFDISDWIIYQQQLLASKKELEKLSLIDDLTHIPNRRAVMEQVDKQLHIHNRKHRELAMAIVDLDHFKEVNDTHGHQYGDEVLRKIAWLLADNLRGYDLLGRYGGEEFLLVLPETSRDEAIEACERLRLAVEAHAFRGREAPFSMTISIGIAWKGAETKGKFDQLFNAADQCLYRAKEGGRNRVVCQEEVSKPLAGSC